MIQVACRKMLCRAKAGTALVPDSKAWHTPPICAHLLSIGTKKIYVLVNKFRLSVTHVAHLSGEARIAPLAAETGRVTSVDTSGAALATDAQ